jgi:hypothetical protein
LNSARAIAMKTGAIMYDGDPCDQCGRTERYAKSASCVKCTRARAKRRKAYGGPLTDPVRLRYLLGLPLSKPTASEENV